MVPSAPLSTPRTPKYLLEAPIHPKNTLKKNSQNRFLDLKLHFSSLRIVQVWKNVFLSNFSLSNFLTDFISCPTTLESESIWTNEKISRAGFGLSNYYLKKFILTICMLKKRSKSEGNPSLFAWKNRKKIKMFFEKWFYMASNASISTPPPKTSFLPGLYFRVSP